MSHYTRRCLGFREGNDVTDGVAASHQHDYAIQTKSQATVRWCTKAQCIEQEAKLLRRFFFTDTQCLKDRLLHAGVSNTYGTTAQLCTIQDQVIGTGRSEEHTSELQSR